MVEQLNWFDLQKYEQCKNFTVKDWHAQALKRLALNEAIKRQDRDTAEFLAYENMSDPLGLQGLFECDSTRSNAIEATTLDDVLLLVYALLAGEIDLFALMSYILGHGGWLNQELEGLSLGKAIVLKSLLDHDVRFDAINNISIRTPREQAFFKQALSPQEGREDSFNPDWAKHNVDKIFEKHLGQRGLANFTVDLGAPDDLIINEMKTWLAKARDQQTKIKSFTRYELDCFSRYEVLAYFDLITFSSLFGVEVSNKTIGDLLYPNETPANIVNATAADQATNLEKRVCETTRKWTNKLISSSGAHVLSVMVANT